MLAQIFNDDLCAAMLLGKLDPRYQISKVNGCDLSMYNQPYSILAIHVNGHIFGWQ